VYPTVYEETKQGFENAECYLQVGTEYKGITGANIFTFSSDLLKLKLNPFLLDYSSMTI